MCLTDKAAAAPTEEKAGVQDRVAALTPEVKSLRKFLTTGSLASLPPSYSMVGKSLEPSWLVPKRGRK